MENGNQPILDNQFEDNKGLTKREYFAGIAMQACLTSGFHLNASDWVRIADALLRELDKSE